MFDPSTIKDIGSACATTIPMVAAAVLAAWQALKPVVGDLSEMAEKAGFKKT